MDWEFTVPGKSFPGITLKRGKRATYRLGRRTRLNELLWASVGTGPDRAVGDRRALPGSERVGARGHRQVGAGNAGNAPCSARLRRGHLAFPGRCPDLQIAAG